MSVILQDGDFALPFHTMPNVRLASVILVHFITVIVFREE